MIPDEAVYAAGDVLVYHQRKGIKGCSCGWSEPGRSFPEHQARLALEAAAPHLMASAWDEGSQSGYRWALIEGPWQEPGEVAPSNPYKESAK
jgi:hypothetical protein